MKKLTALCLALLGKLDLLLLENLPLLHSVNKCNLLCSKP